ncbi:GIY-YIG nuclease family protein [Defluviicoccus vanus]|uniref:Uncharacterized protein n=1 Tax=Defluviicoccus vanus TaxID=111831 RepID=A0A7H1MX92_9PROT|nr:hypothetical protein [Defluviicoccus vanus]QNT68078.1 hypothetical protein HQ394_00270 [Defluviicoccus vanus]
MHAEKIKEYGLKPVAEFWIEENQFRIELTDLETTALKKCVYAFTVEDEIVRVGSSKAPLKKRFGAWRRDVSKALNGEKSATPIEEGHRWRDALHEGCHGIIYARPGTTVHTPLGEISAYLDEECVLLARYKPKLNRSSR